MKGANWFSRIFCALLLIHSSLASAQQIPFKNTDYSTLLPGGALKQQNASTSSTDNTLIVEPSLWQELILLGNNYQTKQKVKSLRSYVKVFVDHSDINVYQPYTYRALIEVKGFTDPFNPNAFSLVDDTLTISYIPDTVNAYQDIHMKSYYGFYKLEVKVKDILDFTALGSSTQFPYPGFIQDNKISLMVKNFKFEGGFNYQLVESKVPSGSASGWTNALPPNSLYVQAAMAAGDNKLRLRWGIDPLFSATMPASSLYELEWQYVDDYSVIFGKNAATPNAAASAKKPATNCYYDFREGATRIITDTNAYSIPLIYKNGYIVYRVRMIRPDYTIFKSSVYSPWSLSTDYGSVGSLSSNEYFAIPAHLEDKFNWNYQVSYAEEGKSKHVLGYFDGLLKDRQTVTKFSSLPNQQIVTEKYYDYSGHPGLQVLPIPVVKDSLTFIRKFAYPATGTATTYTASNIDPITPAVLPGVNTLSQASLYYSPANPFYLQDPKWNFLKALPKDEGYPLVHTKYGDDGRVIAQGGAGDALQIKANGHPTKHYYIPPDQYQLNRYFGANVGAASFYEKTITKDPNNQMSFAIKDNSGKVVLSGLSGDPANPTMPLVVPDGGPSAAGNVVSSDLISGVSPIWTGTASVISKPFFMEKQGAVSFSHTLDLPPFDVCTTGYKLSVPLHYELLLHADDGTPVGGTSPNPGVILNKDAGSLTVATTGPGVPINDVNNPPAVSNVPDGKNTVTYTVSYNQADVESAVNQYMFPSPSGAPTGSLPAVCFKGKDEFEREQLDAISDDCDKLLDVTKIENTCDLKEGLMKSELYPMAKYGKFRKESNGLLLGAWEGIFAIVGYTTGGADQFLPFSMNPPSTQPKPYIYEYSYLGSSLNGYPSTKPIYRYQQFAKEYRQTLQPGDPAIQTYLDIENKDVVDFISEFDDADASALLRMHPEYCDFKKQYCDASNFADELMNLSYKQAKERGLHTLNGIATADPFSSNMSAFGSGYSLKHVNTLKPNWANKTQDRIDQTIYTQLFCSGDDQCPLDVKLLSENNIVSDIDGLTDEKVQDVYFEKLIKLYTANRSDIIERYPSVNPLNCAISSTLYPVPFSIKPKIIDKAYDNASDDYPKASEAGTEIADINTLINNPSQAQTATNNEMGFAEYAQAIVDRLGNCRLALSPGAPALVALKVDLHNYMSAHQNSPSGWKGGITPEILNLKMQNHGIALDDLCNPYLIDYLKDSRINTSKCLDDDFYTSLTTFFNSNSSNALVNAIKYVVSNAASSTTGNLTISYSTSSADRFEKMLFERLIPSPAISPSVISYKLHYKAIGNTQKFHFYFYTGTNLQYSKAVSLELKFTNSPVDFSNFTYYHAPHAASYPARIRFECDATAQVAEGDIAVKPVLQEWSQLPLGQSIQPPSWWDLPEGANEVRWGVIRGLKKPPMPQQACLSCLEMKLAFEKFREHVMGAPVFSTSTFTGSAIYKKDFGYEIKGYNHPFWEDAVRSFFNYYFRKDHTSEEYLKFMQSCNLTRYFKIPSYYGYMYVGTGDNVAASETTADMVDNFFNTYSGGDYKDYRHLYYLVKDQGLTGSTHNIIDFRSFPKQMLRTIKEQLIAHFGSTPVDIYTNKLQSEIAGNSGNFADIFVTSTPALPELNPYLPMNLSAPPPTQSTHNWNPNLCQLNGCPPGGSPGSSANITQLGGSFKNVIIKEAGQQHSYRLFHFDLTNSLPVGSPGGSSYNEVATWTYHFNNSVIPNDGWAFRSFTEYATHVDAVNLDTAKRGYLNYVYNQQSSFPSDLNDWSEDDKAELTSRLQVPVLKPSIVQPNYSLYPYVSYYNPQRTGPSGTLFIVKAGSMPGLGTITNYLNFVLASTGTIFPLGGWGPVSYSAAEQITVKTLADRVVWYHIVNTSTRKHQNFYLKIPTSVYASNISAFNSFNQLEVAPSGSTVMSFKLTATRPGQTLPIVVKGKADFDLAMNQATVFENVMLCDDATSEDESISTCYERQLAAAQQNAEILYRSYIDSVRKDIIDKFTTHIRKNMKSGLKIGYQQTDYQLTAYYYDRAGNLCRTVPPEGITEMADLYQTDINDYRNKTTPSCPNCFPAFPKSTQYVYNSLNRPTWQMTPDGGHADFYYDKAGRLIFSRNAAQASKGKVSYSLYDDQGRLVETGEVAAGATHPLYTQYISRLGNREYTHPNTEMSNIRTALTSCIRNDVTHTFYDQELVNLSAKTGMSRQEFLRGRVATSAHYPTLTFFQTADLSFDLAFHYSYDVSGNVKTLTYDVPPLQDVHQRYKRIDYDYDVMSGKVTLLSYNRSFTDQFYQRYSYDDDNRINTVETSKDGLLWDRDAAYKYYPHGPLARVDLGALAVQGVDYAYTLQGWLKSINGDTPHPAYDLGSDGLASGNKVTMTDLHRSTLYYFNGDYKPIDAAATWQIPETDAVSTLAADPRSLYNGNITAGVSVPGYFPSLFASYTYDQLNRIKEANYRLPDYDLTSSPAVTTLKDFTLFGQNNNNAYKSQYWYDKDGNITSLKRYGLTTANNKLYNNGTHAYQGAAPYLMDDLSYTYAPNANMLRNFDDNAANNSNFTNDLQFYNQSASAAARLTYDNVGNLIQDVSNNITTINWNVANKPTHILFNPAASNNSLRFAYDPLSNRFSKSFQNNALNEYHNEYYYRDATGNILAVYRQVKKFHYGPLLPVLEGMTGSTTFDEDLAGSGLATGGFATELIRRAESDHESFAGTITDHPLSYYLQRNSGLVNNLISTHETLVTDAYEADPTSLQTALVNEFDPNIFGPLLAANNEPPEPGKYDSKAAILGVLLGDGDVETRAALAALAGIEEDVQDKNVFISHFATYVSEHSPEEVYGVLKDGLKETAVSYAINAMMHTPGYLHQQYEGFAYGNLYDYLRQLIVQVTPDGVLANYLGGRSDGAALLHSVTTLGERLGMVYQESPAAFINGLKASPGGLQTISEALQADGATASGLISSMLSVNPTNGTYQNLALATYIDQNYFYLAEHHLYGSSRLGLKTYWPSEYLYRWDTTKTAAENQAMLDASAFSYRTPWYSWRLNDLVNATSLEPFGNASTMPLYSQRVLGQKRYELTNHLGNVMAVTSDKITETSATASAPDVDGETSNKRASLQAAYDYYPFGMLMPNRYLEDNSRQCTPQTVTWYRRVPNTVRATDMGSSAAASGLTLSPDGVEGEAVWVAPEGDLPGYIDLQIMPHLPHNPQGTEVASYGVEGMNGNQAFRVNAHLMSTEHVPLRVEVVQQNEDDEEQVLASYDIAYQAEAVLEGTTVSSQSLQVRLKTTGGNTTIRIFDLGVQTIDVVAGSYVTLLCNDEFGLSKDYRFGFNGQEKTNEIAGIGNHNTAKFWEYDTRLGRRWNLDPVDQISISNYAVNQNNPISVSDPLGDCPNGDCNQEAPKDNSLSGQLKAFGNWLFNTSVEQKYMDLVGNDLNTSLDFISNPDTKVSTPEGTIATLRLSLTLGGAAEIAPLKSVQRGSTALKTSSATNVKGASLPTRLARVVESDFANSPTLAAKGSPDAFVVNPKEIKNLTADQIAKKLTLKNEDGSFRKGPFVIIEFDTPMEGLAQPYNRKNPGFVNGGKTEGGATEYVVPNSKISDLKNVTKTTVE